MKKIVPYIAVILAMLIWAGSGIAVQHSLVFVRPLTLIIIRFTIAILLMFGVGMLANALTANRHEGEQTPLLSLQLIAKKDIPLFLLAGTMQPVLYFIFETYCYRSLASPTIAEALLSTAPLIAPWLAFLILRERVTRNNILGIIISSVGMFMLVLVGSQNFELGNPIGIPLAFLAVCSAVIYTIVLKKIPSRYSPLSIVFYDQLISLLFFYPIWGIVDGKACLTDGLLLTPIAPEMLYSIGYLAVFSSVAAFVLFCYTVRKIGVTEANAFNNARPIFTALIMLAFFGEQLPLGKWIGIALVVIGLFVCQKAEKPRPKGE
ncbi:MAG: EamA family transporter [Paludibacteraceae bacterium]|nr:EamA family transporter [Paludibacteraceae bacterium]